MESSRVQSRRSGWQSAARVLRFFVRIATGASVGPTFGQSEFREMTSRFQPVQSDCGIEGGMGTCEDVSGLQFSDMPITSPGEVSFPALASRARHAGVKNGTPFDQPATGSLRPRASGICSPSAPELIDIQV